VPTIDLTSGVLTVTGTSGADQLRVELLSGYATRIQVSDGSTTQNFLLSSVTRVNVNGLGGNDTLTLNLGNGLINAGGAAALPVNFVGGLGQDTLKVLGSPSSVTLNETYDFGTNRNAGTLSFRSGSATAAALSVAFSELEAIQDTATANSLTINGTAGRDLFQFVNGTTSGGTTSTTLQSGNRDHKVAILHHTGSSSNPTVRIWVDEDAEDAHLEHGDELDTDQSMPGQDQGFVPISFANKTNVTVNGLGGNDVFALNFTQTPAGLQTLRLDGGAGTDILAARTLPGNGVATTLVNVERVLSNADDLFIADLYRLKLHRDADDNELAQWRRFLNGNDRSAALQAILHSLESLDNFVRDLYQTFLGRAPQGNEEMGWVQGLLNGMSQEQLLAQLLATPEFATRANTLIDGSNADQNFVRALYQLVLHRTPSDSDVTAWVNVVQNLGRQVVALAFLKSAEHRGNVITNFYRSFLHRDPDEDGLRNWVRSGLNLSEIERQFLNSEEFFDND